MNNDIAEVLFSKEDIEKQLNMIQNVKDTNKVNLGKS